MGANLTSVDLGAGRTAITVSASMEYTCAILVRPHPVIGKTFQCSDYPVVRRRHSDPTAQ